MIPSRTVQLDSGTLADIATAVWRLRNKLDALPDGAGVRRHVQATFDALADAGVQVQAYRDEVFDPGLAIRVVAFQPAAGLDRETIVETVRPTVYLHGAVIGMGEVIVGTPEPAGEAGRRAGDQDDG